MITLRMITTEYYKQIQRIAVLNALRHDQVAKIMRQVYRGADNHRVIVVFRHIQNKGFINFDPRVQIRSATHD